MLDIRTRFTLTGANLTVYNDALLTRTEQYMLPIAENFIDSNGSTTIKDIAVDDNQNVYLAAGTDNRTGNILYSTGSKQLNPTVPILSFLKSDPNGVVDQTFYNNFLNSSPYGSLSELSYKATFQCILIQTDGKIVVASPQLNRFNSDGTIDSSFGTASISNTTPLSLVISRMIQQSDGKIIIAGVFNRYSGSSASSGIIRINPNNTIDSDFKTGGGFTGSYYGGNTPWVKDVKIQSDGKIVCVGEFNFYSGSTKDYSGSIRLNSSGSIDTTYDPGLSFSGSAGSSKPTTIQINADGRYVFMGDFAKYRDQNCSGIIRTLSDASVDTTFKSGSLTWFGGAPNVYDSLQEPNGKILIGGNFDFYSGSTVPALIRINPNGDIDTDFKSGIFFGVNASAPLKIKRDSLGNLYLLGNFTSYSGSTLGVYSGTVKVKSSGSIDSSYSPVSILNEGFIYPYTPIASNYRNIPVSKIISSSRGGYFVIGNFSRISDVTTDCTGLLKLNSDLTFSSSLVYSGSFSGAPFIPYNIVEQSDTKMVLAGDFTSYKGVNTNRVVRINQDLSKDNTFISGSGFNNSVFALAIDPSSQKIYAGGDFTSYSGSSINRIVRINTDGTVDSTFRTNVGTGFNSTVFKITPQTDGKVLVGGSFATFNGNSSVGIVRLNSDGTYDTTFKTNSGVSSAGTVTDIVSQSDGKIIFCGDFTTYSGSSYCQDIVRVDASGTIDLSFNSGTGLSSAGIFTSIVQTPQGDYIVGNSVPSGANYSGSTFTTQYSQGPIKIYSDGRFNPNFYCPIFGDISSFDRSFVETMVYDTDGGLIIGGSFFWVSGSYQYNIAKINTDNGYIWYTQR